VISGCFTTARNSYGCVGTMSVISALNSPGNDRLTSGVSVSSSRICARS
jgi:hypothetical protein